MIEVLVHEVLTFVASSLGALALVLVALISNRKTRSENRTQHATGLNAVEELRTDVREVKADMREVKADMREVTHRVDRIDARLTENAAP